MIVSCSMGFHRTNNSTDKTKTKNETIAKLDDLERNEGRYAQAFQAWTLLVLWRPFNYKRPDDHMSEIRDLDVHFFSSRRMISKGQSKKRETRTPFIITLKKTVGRTKAMTRNQGGGRSKVGDKKTRVQERSSPRKVILTFLPRVTNAQTQAQHPFSASRKKSKITFCCGNIF